MALFHAVTVRRLGRGDGDGVFAACGVADPARFAAVLAPGFAG
jgi:hypothetical protein